jgi:N-acetylglutamate synthase-like GNAT family acetyltransferase
VTKTAPFAIRTATLSDVPRLSEVIKLSARELSRGDYSSEQIEAALKSAWGVDTQLIRDGTYFVVENECELIGCGGWSNRKTLFGGDAQQGRVPDLLDSAKDACRIRAFFVHPSFARRGIGRLLLTHCEHEAKRAGFKQAELVATLPGVKLYAALGYEEIERKSYPLDGSVSIEFVTMRKADL